MSLNSLLVGFRHYETFFEQIQNFEKNGKIWGFLMFPVQKTFWSLKSASLGTVWPCITIEKFHNNYSMNISNNLLFLNLERGADLLLDN